MGSMAGESPVQVATRHWDPVAGDWGPWVPAEPPGYAQRDEMRNGFGSPTFERASWVERTCRPPSDPDPDRKAQGHYTYSDVEPIDAIEAWGLNFHRGNALKYLARAGHKGSEIEDLRKARSYLTREINRLQGRASWDAQPKEDT